MPLLSSGEHDDLVQGLSGGDTAIIGGISVPCLIGGADAAALQDAASGTPVALSVRAVTVIVRTGALPGLVLGATVTLRGADYTVDRVQRMRNDSLTQFLAYPK